MFQGLLRSLFDLTLCFVLGFSGYCGGGRLTCPCVEPFLALPLFHQSAYLHKLALMIDLRTRVAALLLLKSKRFSLREIAKRLGIR